MSTQPVSTATAEPPRCAGHGFQLGKGASSPTACAMCEADAAAAASPEGYADKNNVYPGCPCRCDVLFEGVFCARCGARAFSR